MVLNSSVDVVLPQIRVSKRRKKIACLFILILISTFAYGKHSWTCNSTLQDRLVLNRSSSYLPSKETQCPATDVNKRSQFTILYPWISDEEREFPIAYAISAYENYSRLARLLRLIYRPHNVYCIHLDLKASYKLEQNVLKLKAQLGANVFLAPNNQRVKVKWGYFSVLESTLLCADILRKQDSFPWNYMLNVNEKEFPLRTNLEMVRALKALNGSNLVEGFEKANFMDRIPRGKPSFTFTWIKGSFLVALRHDFVDYIFTNKYAMEILDLMRAEKNQRRVQDELFFSTLVYNPHLNAPGACLRAHQPNSSDPKSIFLARFVKWVEDGGCKRVKSRHSVCLLGWDDIPQLVQRPEMFANKFMPSFEPDAYDCMERWFVNKLKMESESHQMDPKFDVSIYAQLYCSSEHI